MPYAHTPGATEEWHDLVDHLRGTAILAKEFGADFGAGEAAYFVGLWHDIGKFNSAFQQYLLDCAAGSPSRRRGPDHKAAGAQLAEAKLGLPALLVQGHHGGLRSPTDLRAWLRERQADPATTQALERARQDIADLEPEGEVPLPEHIQADRRAAEFFFRFLFSCLVDGDFLDTERHFDPERSGRRSASVPLQDLLRRFEADQRQLQAESPPSAVNRAREEIYTASLAAADQPPGLFRLAVPTGGGKTRSGLAFALKHAVQHGLRRVVVAVPYLTITEQTVDVYRQILEREGEPEVVLEHHSNVLAGDSDDEGFDRATVWARLAAENWDAPLVVTTTVQLFESIFANQTSRCRKLHRLARSVIILDEAQVLPPHLLQPTLDALRELCTHYGATVVLSTATQPAFEAIPLFAEVPAREIVPEPTRIFETLRRVSYEARTDSPLPWTRVAEIMAGAPQVLAVVNTKKDAIALLEALDDPDALHLSTLLCGAHRRRVIREIRRRLAEGSPCRVVSTQVVEAGVDLDFPVVLRALGPLDGIIQAAGRCNREGKLDRGQVVVFEPEGGGIPPGSYRTATDITRGLLGQVEVDFDDPAVARAYFQQLYQAISTDREKIQELRVGFEYPETARRFRLIDDDTYSVVVTTYGSPEQQSAVQALLEQLRGGAANQRWLARRLQPYTVSLRARESARLQRTGFISPILSGLGEWHGGYDPVRGLVSSDPDPDRWIV